MICALFVCAWLLVVLGVVALCRMAKLGDRADRFATRLFGDGDD